MTRNVRGIVCCVLLVGMPSGCAPRAYKRIALTAPETGNRVATCYVLGRGGSQVLGAGLKKTDGQWHIVGRMAGSPPLTRSDTTLRVEAVTGDESLVSFSTGHAERKRSGVRLRKSRYATFCLEIPDPDSFDHLHLALVSPGERDSILPPHEPEH